MHFIVSAIALLWICSVCALPQQDGYSAVSEQAQPQPQAQYDGQVQAQYEEQVVNQYNQHIEPQNDQQSQPYFDEQSEPYYDQRNQPNYDQQGQPVYQRRQPETTSQEVCLHMTDRPFSWRMLIN